MVPCKCNVVEKCASHTRYSNSIGSVTERQKRKNEARWSSFVFSFSHHYNHQHPRIRSDLNAFVALMGPAPKHFHYYAFHSFVHFFFFLLSVCVVGYVLFKMYFQWAWPLIRCISRIHCTRNVLKRPKKEKRISRHAHTHAHQHATKSGRIKIKNNIENIFVRCVSLSLSVCVFVCIVFVDAATHFIAISICMGRILHTQN